MPANRRENLAGKSRQELKSYFESLGEASYRADQVFEGLCQKLWTHWSEFTSLSKALRTRLEAEADLAWPAILASQSSEDGSTKHVFGFQDGKQAEGVHMPFEDRDSLCLSSQVGCAMDCAFCATAKMAFQRHLRAGEIVGQVMAMLIRHRHAENQPAGRPVNIVFMGMGEPLHNLDNVMAAFEILIEKKGLAIPPRRITLSTSGLVSGIEKLAAFQKRPRLAISLNATTDAKRSRIMPVNNTWNLKALQKALVDFPLENGEHVTLEYVLLKDFNDSLDDARRLAAFASPFRSKINLIPFNPHEGSGFEAPPESRIHEFGRILVAKNLMASVRRSRGQDIKGACGQLARNK